MVKVLARSLYSGPLNDRLQHYIAKLNFPASSLHGDFKIEQQGDDVKFEFSVNGEREAFTLYGWDRDSEIYVEAIRILPWKLFAKAFDILDKGISYRGIPMINDTDLSVYVYPTRMRPSSRGNHDLTLLPVFYYLVWPAWSHAKKVYRKNRTFNTWRVTVKNEFEAKLGIDGTLDELAPDTTVFEELMDRLAVATFTEGQRKKLKDRRENPTPQELALDHAAHLCGVPLYSYSIRQLKEYLKQLIPKGGIKGYIELY